jgi:ribonuclease D|tara:strand:+ start:680 stop:1297 length:618 start_codon:yes stop_codon:yes gene_type:complete
MQIDIKLHKDDLPSEIMLDDKKSLAIDSEFSGLNVNRDKLYLVQISTGNNDAHIIQLNRENYNAPNLKKILVNKDIKKIFHFARADMTFMKKYLNVDVENVECTKLMSKIARSYSDRHGLKDLVKEFLGVEISKQFQSTDFGGDLNEKQLKYCANDVIYLHKIQVNLEEILKREKRYHLYEKSIKFIKTRVDLDLALFTEDIWSH